MRQFKLMVSLLLMVPAWSVIGGLATYDSHGWIWLGLAVGALVGVFFGLVLGGGLPSRWADLLYGPDEPKQAND
jgi:hypothetical protein